MDTIKKFIVLFLIMGIISCVSNKKKTSTEESSVLFQNSVLIYNEYSDKIALIPDSIAMDSLLNEMDRQITDLNFSFAANTDLNLTEQENDSLFKLMNRVLILKKEKLAQINHEYLLRIHANEDL